MENQVQKIDNVTILTEICRKNRGNLTAEAVVKAATPVSHPLHDRFEWDDKKAGHSFRLQQAQHIIRYTVITVPGKSEPVRAFVSLPDDRQCDSDVQYREIVNVMKNETMRKQLLESAKSEMLSFKRRYSELEELSGVFSAMDKV
jgi:hypothetical protein